MTKRNAADRKSKASEIFIHGLLPPSWARSRRVAANIPAAGREQAVNELICQVTGRLQNEHKNRVRRQPRRRGSPTGGPVTRKQNQAPDSQLAHRFERFGAGLVAQPDPRNGPIFQ
jgi:hypothetical protein